MRISIMLAMLALLACGWAGVSRSVAAASSQDDDSLGTQIRKSARTLKDDFKTVGKEVGHGFKNGARDIGHGFRDGFRKLRRDKGAKSRKADDSGGD